MVLNPLLPLLVVTTMEGNAATRAEAKEGLAARTAVVNCR